MLMNLIFLIALPIIAFGDHGTGTDIFSHRLLSQNTQGLRDNELSTVYDIHIHIPTAEDYLGTGPWLADKDTGNDNGSNCSTKTDD
jgi:hypothetical protein